MDCSLYSLSIKIDRAMEIGQMESMGIKDDARTWATWHMRLGYINSRVMEKLNEECLIT